ncbi:MAG: hypothetical protein K2Y39_00090 [Candidatus Obscuribacterales bacterium]|nr:hypothetical protein [Candidatus Obscuribacterales bacterium]
MPAKKLTTQKDGEKNDSGALVRINPADKTLLQELANSEGESMPRILHKAIELYRREKFLKQVNEGYERLNSDQNSLGNDFRERKAWVVAQDEWSREES